MSTPLANPGVLIAPAVPTDLAGLRELESEFRTTLAQRLGGYARFLAQPRWWLELLLLGGLYAIYSVIRNSVGDVAHEAFVSARAILQFEDASYLSVERALNEWVHETPVVAAVVALEYATLHFLVTPAVLIWLFRRRPRHYRAVSGVLMVTTALALIGFYWMPTAPPRLLQREGFVDVMSQTSSWGWWPASGAPGPEAISNQFAAMPSLHCAWATWCGLVLFVLARRMWVRLLGLSYPFITYFVVMGSGNHYLLDVLAGVLLTLVAGAVVRGVIRYRRRSVAVTHG